MSVLFSGTNQGSFTSDGNAKLLNIPADLDWMWVKNFTQLNAAGSDQGVEYYWQRGMAAAAGVRYAKTTATGALQPSTITSNGFTLIDSSNRTLGAQVAVTTVSGATPPRVNATSHGYVTGDVVRMQNIAGAQQLGGIDFYVTRVDANNFDLQYMAPIVAGTTGFVRLVPFDPIYYPRNRYITKVLSSGTSSIITLSVTHGFTVGQKVRFVAPRVTALAFGMTQLDGVLATITAIGDADLNGETNTITVNVDSSAFTAFAFPLTADYPFTPAQVVPVGMNTAQALSSTPQANILADATVNTAYRGIKLGSGTTGPAGSNADVIYWVAGKSFSVDN